jgi:hypothetical protein
MKFIGLLFALIASISLQQGLSSSGLLMLILGLALTFSDAIFFWIKEEIKSSYRKK